VVLPFLAGYFLSYVYRAVNAVLAPTLVGEFGISAEQLGFLTGVYFFSFGLFQIPLGVLLDRFGPRRVNGTLLVLAAAGALAFSKADTFEHLVLARALIGVGVSACLMASIQAFILWFPPERMGTMIALAYSMGGLGAIAASAPLELALRAYSWREIFAFLAAGVFRSIEEAQEHVCPAYTTFPPQLETRETYDKLYGLFRRIYFDFGKPAEGNRFSDVLPTLIQLARG